MKKLLLVHLFLYFSLITNAQILNAYAKITAIDGTKKTLTVANVETIKITATDTTPVDEDGEAAINTSELDLNATSATAVAITGNANLVLDMTVNTAVTSIDASTLTGNLTV